MILTLIILFLIMAFDAVGDGFRTRGWQILHHIFEASLYAMFGWIIWLINNDPVSNFEFRWLIVYIVSMRISFFTFIYNFAAGNKRYYLSTDKWWDRFVRKAGLGFITIMGLVIWGSSIVRLITG